MITTCTYCNKEFEAREADLRRGRAKFCSLGCAGSYGNSLRTTKFVTVNCSSCGKELQRKPAHLKRTKNSFCSRKCKKKFEKQNARRRYGQHRRAALAKKDELLEQFGIVCRVPNCQNDLKGDRKLIDIHHMAGPLDHDDTVLLCPYHHRLADMGYLTSEDLHL